MKINKDSDAFARASAKGYRLLPDMYKPRLISRFGQFVLSRSVVGSRGFVYSVKIWNDDVASFNAVCDCAAGKKDLPCYHVAAVWNDYQVMKSNQQLWNLSLLPMVVNSAYVN